MSNMDVRSGSTRWFYILLALVAIIYSGTAELGQKKVLFVKPTVRLAMVSTTVKVPVSITTGIWVRDQAEGGMGASSVRVPAGKDAPIKGVPSPKHMFNGGAVDRPIPSAGADGAEGTGVTTSTSASTLTSLPVAPGSMGWASLATGGPYCNVSSPTRPFITASAPNFKVAPRSLVPMPVAFNVSSTSASPYAAIGYFPTLMAPPPSLASIEYGNNTALPLPGPYMPVDPSTLMLVPRKTLTFSSVEQPLWSSIATPEETSCDRVSPTLLLLSSPSFLSLEPILPCPYSYAVGTNSSPPCGPWVAWPVETDGLLNTESGLLDHSGGEPALATEPTMSERFWGHWRGIWERLYRFIRREGYTRRRRAAEGSDRIFAQILGVVSHATLT